MNNIKISGIYDSRTMKILTDLGIEEFSFDFRPKSFNFLPVYTYLDLLQKYYNANYKYYLRFHDEKEHVVNKFIEDTYKLKLPGGMYNFILEFSCNNNVSFYDQFKMPYFRYYDVNNNVSDLFSGKFLKGIILRYSFIENLHQSSQLHNFVRNFFSTYYKEINDKRLEIILALDWDSDIIPSLVEYFDFTSYSFHLNSKIEVCYRNIDLNRVKEELFRWSNCSL